MNTIADLKAKLGTQMELAAIDFLNKRGMRTNDRSRCVSVKMTFVDGDVIRLRWRDFMSREFDGMTFKLRPSRDHA